MLDTAGMLTSTHVSVLSCRGGNNSIIREASVYALYPIRSLQWQLQILPFAQQILLS